jgi:DNA polymerase-1
MTTSYSGLGQPSLHLIETIEDAQAFLSWMGEKRPYNAISIDLETGEYPGRDTKDALSPWHGRIRTVQVGDANTGWAMAWDEWSGVFYQAMERHSGFIVCHNIAFEAKWLSVQSRLKFPWHLAHDTMLMAQIITPNESAALKRLTARLVDPRAAQLQSILDDAFKTNGWTWGTVPITYPAYWQYGALDTVITTRLFLDHFYPLVKPGAAYAEPYEIEMAVRRIATTMEINGARVDLDYCKTQRDKLINYTEQVKEWGKQQYGMSITSNVQLATLFQKLGAEITNRTPSGNASVDKDQLSLFVRDGSPEVKNLAETILKQRAADKLASSYFSNFQKDAIDGILHPSINIMAARTSRMSITEPALQTLPSGDPTVRDAFIPRREGEVIVSSDLDQVEFRLTANFSEDPALIELFHEADRTGGDVFTAIMRQVYQDETLQKEDPRRKLIKGCVPLDSKILTKRGWLSYKEVVVGDETIGYDLATGTSKWTPVLGVHVFDDADIYELSNEHKSFLCTEDHRWVADNSQSGPRVSKPKIIHANEFIGGKKRIILAADFEDGSLPITDREASILGWVLGDGSIKRSPDSGGNSQARGSKVGCRVQIFQTKPDEVNKIDQLLEGVTSSRTISRSGQVAWTIEPSYARDLLSRAGIIGKKSFDPWALATGLSLSARKKMLRALDDADGKNKAIDYFAVVQEATSPVVELCIALGYLTGNHAKVDTIAPNGRGWQKNTIKIVRHRKGTMTNQRASLKYVTTDSVWCVTTELGTWTMRQTDEIPVLTGNTVYGKLYGAGVEKMALTAGVGTEQMRDVVTAFDANYPGVKKFQKMVENEGASRLMNEGTAYVLTKTGRRLPADADRIYSLTNYKIQASAAEIFKQNLIKLDNQDLTPYMVVPVHDEIVLSIPKDEAKDALPVIQEAMTTRDGWAVPLTSGAEGPFPTWGWKYHKSNEGKTWENPE